MLQILKLIPVKLLVKSLPDILAFVLTKVLTWLLIKYPEKSGKITETIKELTIAISNAVLAAEDGIITKAEIAKQKELWRHVFKF